VILQIIESGVNFLQQQKTIFESKMIFHSLIRKIKHQFVANPFYQKIWEIVQKHNKIEGVVDFPDPRLRRALVFVGCGIDDVNKDTGSRSFGQTVDHSFHFGRVGIKVANVCSHKNFMLMLANVSIFVKIF
jgi:hypothetical protein